MLEREREEVMESIRQLREKFKAVIRVNKHLKEELRTIQDTAAKQVEKVKSAVENERSIQNLLYNHLGAITVQKDDCIEVYLKPICSGVWQRQYIIILQILGENSWQVAGYDLPLSIPKRQGMKISSRNELGEFIREVSREVQAYADRNYQFTKTEELFKTVDASIWYTTKRQIVYLNLPMTLPDGGKSVCNVELSYEVADSLPFQVTINVSGLDDAKKDKLKKRMEKLLQHFSLLTVMKEEYSNDSQVQPSLEGTVRSSILGNLSP